MTETRFIYFRTAVLLLVVLVGQQSMLTLAAYERFNCTKDSDIELLLLFNPAEDYYPTIHQKWIDMQKNHQFKDRLDDLIREIPRVKLAVSIMGDFHGWSGASCSDFSGELSTNTTLHAEIFQNADLITRPARPLPIWGSIKEQADNDFLLGWSKTNEDGLTEDGRRVFKVIVVITAMYDQHFNEPRFCGIPYPNPRQLDLIRENNINILWMTRVGCYMCYYLACFHAKINNTFSHLMDYTEDIFDQVVVDTGKFLCGDFSGNGDPPPKPKSFLASEMVPSHQDFDSYAAIPGEINLPNPFCDQMYDYFNGKGR